MEEENCISFLPFSSSFSLCRTEAYLGGESLNTVLNGLFYSIFNNVNDEDMAIPPSLNFNFTVEC